MKKISILFILFISVISKCTNAQEIKTLEEVKTKIKGIIPVSSDQLSQGKFNSIVDVILNDPGVYNEIWNRVYNSLRKNDKQLVLKNLKIDFKTFQSNDSSKASLGFSYKWNYDINKKRNSDYNRSEFIAKINTAGNIAFQKKLNPIDFQEAKLDLGWNGFSGGTVNQQSEAFTQKLNAINQKLAAIDDEKELAKSELWNELTSAIGITNQYHYNISAKTGWEGSQDFSKSQWTYGVQATLSAKSYSDKNILSKLNILDYPFALIRYLTGTDSKLQPYGATLPIVIVGIDMVDPAKDSARKNILANDKQYARFRFEAGFRTLIASFNQMPLHFNAAYRFFNELNAPAAIKTAGLNQYSYFTCSVTGADTYFFSYSYGKLPFDRKKNAIYELGFKFKL